MKQAAKNIIRGTLLAAVASFFHQKAQAEEPHTTAEFLDDSHRQETDALGPKVIHNVAALTANGDVRFLASHRSHSSHSSHRSSSYGGGGGHYSHTSHRSSSYGGSYTPAASSSSSSYRSSSSATSTRAASTTSSKTSASFRTLKYESPMMYGDDVTELVKLLEKAYCGPDPADMMKTDDGKTIFNQNVERGVKLFQASLGLTPTGIVTKDLWTKLKAAAK